MIIYKATNIISKKCYIGQTKFSLDKRKTLHLNSSKRNKDNLYFYNSLRKHGSDNFEWKILCECDSKEELDEMEFHYIKQYNSLSPNGYNLTLGGEGTHGYKRSPDQIERMSKNAKIFWKNVSDEYKKEFSNRIKNLHTGKKLTKDHKLNISKSRKGKGPKNISEEHKKKIGDGVRGQKRTTHTKKLMKQNQLGKNNSFYGKCHTKEQLEKMSRTIFHILDENGDIHKTKVFSVWCKENNIKASSLHYQSLKNKFFNGYKVIKKIKI